MTIKTSALALCYSTAEYCAPVWARSCHAAKVDVELNHTCRTITGNLKPTPLSSLYCLASIAPPSIRRETLAKSERDKQMTDNRHPMYGHQQVQQRLKSRKSFATVSGLQGLKPPQYRLEKWLQNDQTPPHESVPPPSETLPNGTSFIRKDWVTLNRARARVGRTNNNLHRWGLAASAACPCGEPDQTMDHILRDCKLGPNCSNKDLLEASNTSLQWTKWWSDKI